LSLVSILSADHGPSVEAIEDEEENKIVFVC